MILKIQWNSFRENPNMQYEIKLKAECENRIADESLFCSAYLSWEGQTCIHLPRQYFRAPFQHL